MPVASPFLDDRLDTWCTQTRQTRRECEAKTDEFLYARQDLQDARTRLQQQRHSRLETIASTQATLDSRWSERLRRIDEWRSHMDGLIESGEHVKQLGKTLNWFERAAQTALPFNQRLYDIGMRLESRRNMLHDALKTWQERLGERTAALRAIEDKTAERAGALLMSRARKQPEELFVHQETLTEHQLESELQALRQAATHLVGRLYKATITLEKRSQESPVLFEIFRRQIEQDLQKTYDFLFSLRQRILNDVLLFEGNRRNLRGMRECVDRIQCVEDVYPAEPSRWRRWMKRLTTA
ncbi:MAG: hypothetical protein WC859_01410 [Elusimicrobiota bacterium]|jgi:hypothetical protein